MQNTPLPTYDVPAPSVPSSKMPRKKSILLGLVAAIVLAAALVLVYRLTHPSSAPAAFVDASKQSLTMYYRDGKTVLWQSRPGDSATRSGSYFVDYVKAQMQDNYGYDYQKQGAWQVTTTLDFDIQKTAQEQMQQLSTALLKQRGSAAALMAQDATNGQVLSWVGGLQDPSSDAPDVLRQKVELGTLALPITYAAYLEKSPAHHADTVLNDVRQPLTGYPCTNPDYRWGNCLVNLDARYVGPISLRQALGQLRFVPAVLASQEVGVEAIVNMADKMSAEDSFNCYTDIALTMDTACHDVSSIGRGVFMRPQRALQAYATLANDGNKMPQTVLLKTELNGKVKYEFSLPKGEQVLQATTAQTLKDILSDPEASYLNRSNAFPIHSAKVGLATGATSDAHVASSIQYTSRYVVGVWALSKPDDAIVGPTHTLTLPVTSAVMDVANNRL
jgi:membrane peptidoglycan carboxypeptidase